MKWEDITDASPVVRGNRDILARQLGSSIEWECITDQKHTNFVHVASRDDLGLSDKPLHMQYVDGVVTDIPGVVLTVFGGDCPPVYIVDPVRKAAGLVHAGWRGTLGRIPEVAVANMVVKFGCDPADMYAAIGPGVCRDCYEMGDEIYDEFAEKFAITKYRTSVSGGKTRQESVLKGIEALSDDVKYVAIADGARCLTTPTQITKVCLCAYRQMSACAAHKVTDTVKRATVMHNTTETIDRKDLWEMQTPQVFNTALYKAAMIRAEENKLTATDDATLVEGLGYRTHLVECGIGNIKITTIDDIPFAEAILSYRTRNKQA
jgi:2-C-methyl-D-erythritol 4-phosphate cytidylyltransferase